MNFQVSVIMQFIFVPAVVLQFMQQPLQAQHTNLFIISETGKIGYIDSTGRVCIQPQFSYGAQTGISTVVVKNNADKWGIVDAARNTILPFRYTFIYYHKPGIVTRAERKHKTGEVTPEGRFVPFPGKQIERVSGDFSASNFPTPFCTNARKWGYLDKKGKIIIKAQYEYAGSFCQGLAPVKQNGKYGYISTTGQLVLLPAYDHASGFGLYHNTILAAVRQNHLIYVIDVKGNRYYDTGFTSFRFPFGEQWAPFTRNGKMGFIDSHLNIRIAPVFDSIVSLGFSENHWIIPAKKDNKWGFIDTAGTFIIAPVYDDASAFENGYAWVKQNGQYALLNAEGKLKSNFEFSAYRHTLPGTATILLAAQKEKWAIITPSLEERTGYIFDELRDGGHGLILARKQQRWGVISANGKTLIPFEYGEILVYGRTIARYKKSAADALVPDAYFNDKGELLWLKTE